ncbi:MAG TPA: hypothetical protein VF018_11585 [Acidobacteriaceae bacterium]
MYRFKRLLLAFLAIAWPCLAQIVPTTTAKTLDGTTIVIPRPESRKPLLLLVGFSHKSSEDFKQWNQRMLSAYLSDPRIDYFELADLQGIPSFVQGMILHGMRRQVPVAQHSHFAPFTAGEEEWKRTVAYSASYNTYLVLTDASGHILWKTHGVPDDEKISELKKSLTGVLSPARH